jgi:hypothetical protein
MGEGNDFMELLCWPAIGRLLIVSPFRMYPNRDYPCQDQPFQDVVAGPPTKAGGIQFESCQGHLKPPIYVDCFFNYLYKLGNVALLNVKTRKSW